MAESGPDPKVLLGDRGYDADPIRADVEARGGTPVIPTKRKRKVQIATDGFIYALRNRIERGINRLKNSRRVATRYDKTATSFASGYATLSTRPSSMAISRMVDTEEHGRLLDLGRLQPFSRTSLAQFGGARL